MEERTYTIPLRRGFWKTPRYKRTNKAVRVLREFLQQHMKTEDVKLGQHLNHFLWQNGIKNPPPRVMVTVKKDEKGVALAELAGKTFTRIEPPKEREEQPQGLKEKLQAMTKKEDAPETEAAVEEAKEALEKPADEKKPEESK